jgi:hypothetical protein
MSRTRPKVEQTPRYFPPRDLPTDEVELASEDHVRAILVMITFDFPIQSRA